MLQGVITAAARAKILQRQVINISSFKIGSLSSYVPEETATDVSGEVYESNDFTYSIVDDSTAKININLTTEIGDFTIGNIGIYLDDGTLFALAVLPGPSYKIRSNPPQIGGNVRNYDILIHYRGLEDSINLVVSETANTDIPEVNNVNNLPPELTAPHKNYIVQEHTGLGVPALAYLNQDLSVWQFAAISGSEHLEVVKNLADFKALEYRPTFVFMLSKSNYGDGSGLFYWEANSSTPGDDIFIIDPTTGPAGKYKIITYINRTCLVDDLGPATYVGMKAFVTDATVPLNSAGVGTTVAGGGSNRVPVYADGTNWKIG